MKKSYPVIVKIPEKGICTALDLIHKFFEVNKIDLPFNIVVDCSLPYYGMYWHTTNDIILNMDLIKNPKDGRITDYGYVEDYSIEGVTIHEICHFIDCKLRLFDEFKKEFASEKVYLNFNSTKSKEEMMVESLALYIINPYLLKNMDRVLFDYWSDEFKSPTPCTKAEFRKIYSKWKQETKDDCLKKWGISL